MFRFGPGCCCSEPLPCQLNAQFNDFVNGLYWQEVRGDWEYFSGEVAIGVGPFFGAPLPEHMDVLIKYDRSFPAENLMCQVTASAGSNTRPNKKARIALYIDDVISYYAECHYILNQPGVTNGWYLRLLDGGGTPITTALVQPGESFRVAVYHREDGSCVLAASRTQAANVWPVGLRVEIDPIPAGSLKFGLQGLHPYSQSPTRFSAWRISRSDKDCSGLGDLVDP